MRFPYPEDMASLAGSLVSTVQGLQVLRHDLHNASGQVSRLIVGAHDYARQCSWPAEWGLKPSGDMAASVAYRNVFDAADALNQAEAALRLLASTVKATAQRVADAEAQHAAKVAAGARLRG